MRAIVLNCKIAKTLTLVLVIMPRTALSDASLADILKAKDTSVREVVDESDPDASDTRDCFALGDLNIVFRTDNNGSPNIGVVLTDPRGRRIGFDPITSNAWQELPVAQGYIDCDDLDGADTCRGIVEVCGPLSGTYTLEVIGQQTTVYSLSVFARSKEALHGDGLQSHSSEADVNSIPIRERSRDIVLVKYSRDPREQVTAQLQHPLRAQGATRVFIGMPMLEQRKSSCAFRSWHAIFRQCGMFCSRNRDHYSPKETPPWLGWQPFL